MLDRIARITAVDVALFVCDWIINWNVNDFFDAVDALVGLP